MCALEPTGLDAVRQLAGRHTQARLFLDGSAASYDTATALRLRADHAAARDAVSSEWSTAPAGVELDLSSRARDRATYLRRPDQGRLLDEPSRDLLESVRAPADVQIVLGDGLSPGAAEHDGSALLEPLRDGFRHRGLVVAPVVGVRQARVGVLNDIGPRTDAWGVVLLIGERPGLVTAESLSAYLAWRPAPGATDADRNLISNIHARGVALGEAAERIVALVVQISERRQSGVAVKEQVGERVVAAPLTDHSGESSARQTR